MVFQLFTLAGAEALLISAHVITEYFQNFPTNVDFSVRIKTFRGYIFCMIIIHLILWEINMSLSIIEPEICKIKSLKSKLGMLISIAFISDMHCLRVALDHSIIVVIVYLLLQLAEILIWIYIYKFCYHRHRLSTCRAIC